MLIVVQSRRLDGEDHWVVQIRSPQAQEAPLLVTLSKEGNFLTGSHSGSPVDEVGAIDALELYAPYIGGHWHKVGVTP